MLLFVGLKSFSQDPAFSQFYSASAFLNPALIGEETNTTFVLMQHSNTNRQFFPYSLSHFSFLTPLQAKRYRQSKKYFRNGYYGAVGATVFNEVSGHKNQYVITGIAGSFAYFFQLSHNHFLSLGSKVGFLQKSIDPEGNWGTQYQEDLGFNNGIIPSIEQMNEKVSFPVVNSGLVWYYRPYQTYTNKPKFNMFHGIGISNMNTPDESFFDNATSELPVLYKLHGGFSFQVADELAIMPNYLIMHQNNEQLINIGTFLNYSVYPKTKLTQKKTINIQLGSWYRLNDSFIFAIGFRRDALQVALSYDFNKMYFNYYSSGTGAYEITLTYRILKDENIRRNISRPFM